MEKLDIQVFRKLKQETVKIIERAENENSTNEEIEQLFERYKEIIEILSEHDLSDIDFEEWRGMTLDPEVLDFSKSKANIDFSIIEYYDQKGVIPNFKGCKIKNFDFKKYYYSPEMFDAEYIKENEDMFLSENISKEVADRFYKGETTLTDIQNNPELMKKVEEKNMDKYLAEIYKAIGIEELCKLDAQFIDGVLEKQYSMLRVLKDNPELTTAEKIMPALYQFARKTIIGYSRINMGDLSLRQDTLGENFRKQNPDLFLDENAPESVKKDYYRRKLSLEEFSQNLKWFEGKTVLQAFSKKTYKEENFVNLLGEKIYQLFSNYKPIMDKLLQDMEKIKVPYILPGMSITDSYRRGILSDMFESDVGLKSIQNWDELKMILDFVPMERLNFSPNTTKLIEKYGLETLEKSGLDVQDFLQGRTITNIKKIASLKNFDLLFDLLDIKTIQNWDELKMILDFVPMKYLNFPPNATSFIEKYGLETLEKSGLDVQFFLQGRTTTNIKEIVSLENFDLLDIKKIVPTKHWWVLKQYDTKQLLEYGVKDLSELFENTNDLKQVRDMLKKIPIELITMGKNGELKKKFIKKYGIDNIITLDEETKGMFSHPVWSNDIYLTLFAMVENNENNQEIGTQITYEQFQDKMYEILLHARDEKGILTSGDFPGYDFIKGKFREEHPEIFIDGDVPETVKNAFYTRRMTAEMVRQNPNLIKLLKDKDLNRAFPQKMNAGFSAVQKDEKGNIIGGIPNTVNMAEFISEKLGQDNFLKICADYGKCLDEVNILVKDEITFESLREKIEQSIYKTIKEKGIEYFEELPLNFKTQHPELFLPKEIDESIRKKFYEGNLTFSDIRKYPQIKEVLPTKDMRVGFRNMRLVSFKVLKLMEKISGREIVNLAEKYGDYLIDVDTNIFIEGKTEQEMIVNIQNAIEYNILNRKGYSQFNENVPEFFKTKHPEMFLDSNAPEDLKKCFYDSGKLSFLSIKEHPEWREFLEGKDLSRAFSAEHKELFTRFDDETLMKIGVKYAETIEKMVENHKEDTLQNWYKATGGKFVPHHVVMLNYPEGEIDSFLANGKRWSQLMKIENYNLNDDGKTAILKAAYSMGVFRSDDDGFNKTMKLFTDVPQELTQEEYDKATGTLESSEEIKNLFKQAYTLNDDGKYVFGMDKQKNKDSVKTIRKILENAQIPRILTPEKAHQMFDSFLLEYNPDFAKFFNDNLKEILSNQEYTKDIATIQRQFKDIVKTNAGRRLTLDVAQNYIKSIAYTDIEVGNEKVAEQAKIAGYSQKDFETIQHLYNEGETRDFSSIPRIQGSNKGYTYEMLRCDDPLGLTIGTLTDCCQEIHGAGQTSMEHSVVSPDGRVFCVKDVEGRLVAQSWFWRNQYTGCFDNIEIPDRIFDLYNKEHPDLGRKGLTTDVLEVYKKAAQDLMQEDARVYKELLENGTITQEQYDSLLLGKVTIGLGYNDIADAIKDDKTIHVETDSVQVKGTARLPHPYTDASTQYTIAERENIQKSNHENLYVHQDDVPVFDGTNMPNTLLLTMQRMEQATERKNLQYLRERRDEDELPTSQRIINSIAREYDLDPKDTRVMATARVALIYSKDENNKVKIGDLLSAPLKPGLTEEQKQKAETHIMNQVKKSLKQIGIQDSEVDISSLTEEQQQMIQSVMKEIEKENDERGER